MSLKKYRHILQKFVLFLSLAVFIVANVGILISTHSCKISGTEKMIFASIEDPCEEHVPVKESSCCTVDAPTCTTNTNDSKQITSKCCFSDTDYISLTIDLNIDQSNNQLDLIPFAFDGYSHSAIVSTFSFNHSQENKVFFDSPPEKLQGRSLQNLNQVFLI